MNINFEIIETNRLLLKGLSPIEMNNVFENNSKDDIKKILGHRSEKDYFEEEFKYKNGYASYNRSFILFLLTDKTTNHIIGRCGIHNWNKDHRRAEIGYNMIDEQYLKKGIMSEAVKAIIDFGFKKMNLNRLEALVGTNNIASLKIMKNNHFKEEGILRQHYFIANKYEDSMMFSILHNEYKED